MKYGILLLLIGIAQVTFAVSTRGWGWLLLWPALSFAAVGLAYCARRSSLFGKRGDGTMAWLNVILLLPFLLLAWTVWYVQTRTTKEPACHEIAPGLWLGRRVSSNRPPVCVSLIVDLTSEFPESRACLEGHTYLCLPTLDHEAPERRSFQRAVQTVTEWRGGVYIHCALGHGRAAMLAAAVLVAKGQAETVEHAIRQIKAVRPGVRLSTAQWRSLRQRT